MMPDQLVAELPEAAKTSGKGARIKASSAPVLFDMNTRTTHRAMGSGAARVLVGMSNQPSGDTAGTSQTTNSPLPPDASPVQQSPKKRTTRGMKVGEAGHHLVLRHLGHTEAVRSPGTATPSPAGSNQPFVTPHTLQSPEPKVTEGSPPPATTGLASKDAEGTATLRYVHLLFDILARVCR